MPHYDSSIRARIVEGNLQGTWTKQRGPGKISSVPFHATQHLVPVVHAGSSPPTSPFDGRWAVDFESDDLPAVGVFNAIGPSVTRGTFLTATGDYRYLAGTHEDRSLRLSCFDGAHAFLFSATLQEDGSLSGDFWSGNWYHETWKAVRDEGAELGDAFAQTKWNGQTKLADLAFPDLEGKKHSLGDFAGQATLLVVFGSWCPNCNDEAKLLAELDAAYRGRGLRILGLAFELTEDFERDAEQVRIFAKRHALTIPFFLCGNADKAEATKALGMVDRIRSFPTTIFVGADGLPRAIHSGFAGPATGEAHAELRREFVERIEALLPVR